MVTYDAATGRITSVAPATATVDANGILTLTDNLVNGGRKFYGVSATVPD